MTMSTDADIQEYFPDLYDYGIQDFSDYHEKTRQDIFRRLRIEWWPTKSRALKYNIAVVATDPEMDETLLTESQFKRAAVFHCLAYYILPQLNKFEPDGDRFGEMMKYYKARFEEEFDLVVRDGVEYDSNNDNVLSDGEKATTAYLRLVR
jgi:hypothetical protein